MNLVRFFDDHTTRHADRLAIQMKPRYRTLRWTYRDLAQRSVALAGELFRRGVAPGDRVLLYAPNSPHWAAAFFAILRRGAIVVPINPQSTPEQINRIVGKVKPKLLLLSRRHPWGAQNLPSLQIESADELPADPGPPTPDIPDGATAEIVFTSGTTGNPKGVVLSHANFLATFEALSQSLRIKVEAHALNLVPLYHVYAQMVGMILPLGHGIGVTHIPSFSSRVIRSALAAAPATHLIAVPEFLKVALARLEENLKARRLPPPWSVPGADRFPFFLRRALFAPVRRRVSKTLHTISCGGAPLDPELERRWRCLGLHVLQGYGLTETCAVLSANTYWERRYGAVGKPLPGVEIKISAEGEILARGPNVMSGYYEDPQRTREVFEAGWLKTNDGGNLDPDGFIRVFGRRNYMILGPGGENVFPEDIEAELVKIPGVEDSAVVGLEEGGRTAIHAVLLGNLPDPAAAVAEANRRLARHQQIMQWSVWPQADFPRSATRKVRKDEVIAWLQSAKRGETKPAAPPAATPLARLLAQVTERDPRLIHAGTRIVPELHLDSLMRIELVSRLEEEYEVGIEERLITPQTTVADLEKLVAERRGKGAAAPAFPVWSLNLPARLARRLFRSLVCFSWASPYVRIRRSGLENLDPVAGQPVIFTANHTSYLDSLAALWGIPKTWRTRTAIAAAIDPLYKHHPFLARWTDLFMNTYPFATETEENIKPSLEYTGWLLDRGWNILLFPEGAINRSGQPMQPLKGGAGVVAVEMQAPVVPLILRGTAKLVPADKKWFVTRGEVEVRFGKPLRFSSSTPYADATRAIERAMLDLINHRDARQA